MITHCFQNPENNFRQFNIDIGISSKMTKTRVLIIGDSNFQEEIRSKIAHFFIILSKSQTQEEKY